MRVVSHQGARFVNQRCVCQCLVGSVRLETAPTAIKEFSRVYASVDTPARF